MGVLRRAELVRVVGLVVVGFIGGTRKASRGTALLHPKHTVIHLNIYININIYSKKKLILPIFYVNIIIP